MRSISEKIIRLADAIEIRELADGTRLVKQLVRSEYMAFKPEQWGIIGLFDGQRTVEQALHSLLKEGRHPGIRPFYDLVLNAWTKGILVEVGPPQPVSATTIPARLHPETAGNMGLSMLIIAAGSYAFIETVIAFQYRSVDWLQLVLFISLGVSLSYALAGATLARLGRKVGEVRFRWDRGLPFLSVDTRDAFMGGRFCEAAVALRALAAPFMLALISMLVESNNGLLGSGIAMLIIGCPFGATAAHNLLHALFRKEYELPRCAEQFLQTRLVAQMFNWKDKLVEERYLMTYSAYAITWLGVCFHYANEVFGLMVRRSIAAPDEVFGQAILSLNLAVISIAIASVLVFTAWIAAKATHRILAPHLFPAETAVSKNAVTDQRPPDETLQTFLKSNLLFSQLTSDVLRQTLKAMKFVVVEPGTTIIRERDIGDSMFVVYAGHVEVFRELESGEEQRVATLEAGDAFGEIALLDKVPRTRSVRSAVKTDLLVLGKEDFEKLLVSELGAEQVRETIQICSFLRRNKLFADWHPQALLAMANRFKLIDCEAGEFILRQNEANDAFYLIYEGAYKVRQDGKHLAMLGAGDFVGEVSLLRDTVAMADVIADGPSRCLRLGKEDFLRFVSHDFLTGMAIGTALEARTEGNA